MEELEALLRWSEEFRLLFLPPSSSYWDTCQTAEARNFSMPHHPPLRTPREVHTCELVFQLFSSPTRECAVVSLITRTRVSGHTLECKLCVLFLLLLQSWSKKGCRRFLRLLFFYMKLSWHDCLWLQSSSLWKECAACVLFRPFRDVNARHTRLIVYIAGAQTMMQLLLKLLYTTRMPRSLSKGRWLAWCPTFVPRL